MKYQNPYDPEPHRTAGERQAEAEKNGAAAIVPDLVPAPVAPAAPDAKGAARSRRFETQPEKSGAVEEK